MTATSIGRREPAGLGWSDNVRTGTPSRVFRHAMAVTVLLGIPSSAGCQDYGSQPLLAPVAYPADGLPVDAKEFMEWLDEAIALPDTFALREHVYAHIAERVKRRYAEAGSVTPDPGDNLLANLFLWSHRFGVPGSGQVASLFDGVPTKSDPGMVADGFSLTFDPPSFSLVSNNAGWMVRFPYYFMPGVPVRQRTNNGLVTDIALVSTLTAANDEAVGGASQATILMLSAQTTDVPAFAAFWLASVGLQPQDTTSNPVPNAVKTYRGLVEGSSIWVELVVFEIPSGALLLVYSGLDGTFQTNYPHFVDLLNTLRVRG
jgi:hypothetical protein